MLSAKHDWDYDNVVLGRLTLWINLFICPLHSHYITVFLFSLRLIVTLSLMFHKGTLQRQKDSLGFDPPNGWVCLY